MKRGKRSIGAMQAALAALALGLFGYGVGCLQGWLQKRESEKQTQELRMNAARLQFDKYNLQLRLRRLEARRQLSLALQAVTEHNFGVSKGHLQACLRLLGDDRSADATRWAPLSQKLREHLQQRKDEAKQQLEGIRALLSDFDRLMPPQIHP